MLVRELRKLLSLQDPDAEVVLVIDATDDPQIPYDELVSFIDDCMCLETDNDGRIVLAGWVGNDDDSDGDADEDEDDQDEEDDAEAGDVDE